MFKINHWLLAASLIGGITICNVSNIHVDAKKAKTVYKAVNPNRSQTLILGLRPKKQSELTRFIYQTTTPGNVNYRKYLTPQQFGHKYGLSDQKVRVVGKYLHQQHLKTYTYPGNLIMTVSGKTKDLERVFSLNLEQSVNKTHNVQVARGTGHLNRALKDDVIYLDKDYLNHEINSEVGVKPTPRPGVIKGLSPEQFLNAVKDPNIRDRSFQKFNRVYNADSLLEAGHQGQHQTIGIISPADVNIKDVQAYWQKYGVTSQPNRIQKSYVDRFISKDGGNQEESTMDVEQASSIAPQANVKLYVGDNTNDGPLLLNYAQAIGENQVSVISNSYGSFESDYLKAKDRQSLMGFRVLNLLLKQAAAQGITNFNAAGDNGAYAFQSNSKQVSAGMPVDSPYMTAVGGTTLPFHDLPFSLLAGMNPLFKLSQDKTVSIDHEIVWNQNNILNQFGHKYIRQSEIEYVRFIVANIKDPKLKKKYQKELNKELRQNASKVVTAMALYGSYVGGGGGISRFYKMPIFQRQFGRINDYQYGQYLNTQTGKVNANPIIKSSSQNGRNVPDISGNADMYTGYSIVFQGKENLFGGGGTSVITPQMAGMAAVINSAQGVRTGFWNPQLYRFAKQINSPFTPLNTPNNNNFYYVAKAHQLYNPVTGLGTVDFTKLNQKFSSQ